MAPNHSKPVKNPSTGGPQLRILELYGYTVEQVKKFVQYLRGRKAPAYDVVIFRDVLEPVESACARRRMEDLIFRHPNSFYEQTIRKSKPVRGVSIKDNDGNLLPGSFHDLRAHILDPTETLYFDMTSYDSILKGHEAICKLVGDGKFNLTYGMNLELNNVESSLFDFPLYIDPKIKSLVKPMPGINQPSFYIASRYSYTPFHMEDGGLDSVNVVHYCTGKYAKIWHFISRDDMPHARHCFGGDTKNLFDNGEAPQGFERGCANPEQHKAFLRTVGNMEKAGIRSQLIVQRPRDIVYVDPNVPHQVLNLDANLAEAVNIGGTSWLAGRSMFSRCVCEGCEIKDIPAPLDRYVCFETKTIPVYECPEEGCLTMWKTEKEMLHHRDTHKIPARCMPLRCTLCHVYLQNGVNLSRHHERMHPIPEVAHGKTQCIGCGKWLKPSTMAKHRRSACGNKETCSKCHREFSSKGHATHEKTCGKLSLWRRRELVWFSNNSAILATQHSA